MPDSQTDLERFKEDLRKQLIDPDGEHTDEETLRSLQYLKARLRAAWTQIESITLPSPRLIALRNLARYAGWLLLMLEEGLGRPIEFYGWISRGLFELYVLTRFVISSDENLDIFVSSAATDEIMNDGGHS